MSCDGGWGEGGAYTPPDEVSDDIDEACATGLKLQNEGVCKWVEEGGCKWAEEGGVVYTPDKDNGDDGTDDGL